MDLFQKREVFKDQIMMPPNEPLVRPFILQINSVPKYLGHVVKLILCPSTFEHNYVTMLAGQLSRNKGKYIA